MNRRKLIQHLGAAAGCAATGALTSCAGIINRPLRRRPNIVLITVDDMGYSDIGCYGAEIRTPHIDWLAANGARLTQFYTNPVCTPTRASLLTGRYAHQAGLATNNTWPSVNHNLSPEELEKATARRGNSFWDRMAWPAYHVLRTGDTCVSLGDVLRAAGYQTFMAGKWHVGDEKKYWPCNQGFDRSFVMIWGGGGHFKPPFSPYALDDQPFMDFPDDFYTTDYFFKYGIEFIEQSDRSKPFFLYLTPSAPHAPYQAWPEDIKKYDGVYDEGWDVIRERRLARQKQMGLYPDSLQLPPRIEGQTSWADEKDKENAANSMEVLAAMVNRVDQKVGELISTLRRMGELDNTLILFCSDNGGTPTTFGKPPQAFHPWGETRNTPCSKQKGWTHEGGIRSPLVAFWPDRIPAGAINHGYAGHVMDFMPTFLEVAQSSYPESLNGCRPEPMEGTSLLPALMNAQSLRAGRLFWEFSGSGAAREGDWKLVREFTPLYFGRGEAKQRSGQWELYNVREDPGETNNLIERHPEKARQLQAAYFEWEKRVGVVPYEEIKQKQSELGIRNHE